MGYRCANDSYGYCSDSPEWGKPPKQLGPGLYPAGGSCKLGPKTCGKHQTLSQQLEGVVLHKGSYRHSNGQVSNRINQLPRREAGKSKRRKRTRAD